MNKKQAVSLGIALTLLIGIALATSSASSEVVIYAFDQKLAGSDKGNEGVTLYNPSYHDGYSVEPKPLLMPK